MKVKNFAVLLLSVFVFSSIGFSMVASADDDERDGDIYEQQESEQDDDEQESQPAPQVVKVPKPKTVTQKITDPATTVVVNELRNIELIDSDRDGLVDTEDPHPEKSEIYLVRDDNQNGFVDTFESYVAR